MVNYTVVYRVERPKRCSSKIMMGYVEPINQDPDYMIGYNDLVIIGQR